MKQDKCNLNTIGLISLGCPKNLIDSETMLARIGQAGYVITDDLTQCDAIIINTCGFIEAAKNEAISIINDVIESTITKKDVKIIVAGCLAQRMGQSIKSHLKGKVDAIIGLSLRDNISSILNDLFTSQTDTYISTDATFTTTSDDRGRLLLTPSHWAYLRISDGCDRKCAFCTIPSIRGPFRSKPLELILSEAGELVANGAKELILIAQDSVAYGRDLGYKDGLCNLLSELEKLDKLKWIRLMYLYPSGIKDNLIEVIAASKKIVNYVDIPIQHINNQILKSMHRSDRKEKIIDLIEKLRNLIPDMVLRTTVIAGYPGETQEHFNELLEFIQWAQFDALGCFPYYAEQGTAAAEMPGQLAEDIKNQRVEEIMLTQQEIAFSKNRSRIGNTLECLVDEYQGKEALGRFYGQAPDIDSICRIKNCKAKPGSFTRVIVKKTSDYDLITTEI